MIFACIAGGCPCDQNGRYSGNFSSPYYPINYRNKKRCTWGITVPGDYRILVAFDEFHTQRNSDVLRIYDGASNSSDLLMTLSGELSGSTYGSSGSSLWFEFTTDGSITEKGFHATYTATQQPSMYYLDSHFVTEKLLVLFPTSSMNHLPVHNLCMDFFAPLKQVLIDELIKSYPLINSLIRSFLNSLTSSNYSCLKGYEFKKRIFFFCRQSLQALIG